MSHMPWFAWGTTETLYSIVSRSHVLCGHPDPRSTAELAFGYERAWAQANFERGLEHFCDFAGVQAKRLGEIVANRTLWPFARKFFDTGRSKVDETYVRKGRLEDGGRALEYIGLLPNGGIKLLKGCIACAAQDRDMLGGATWRIEHQLPGLLFCNAHGEPLQGARVGNNPAWVTADEMRPISNLPSSDDRARSIGLFLDLFYREQKATRGSVQQIIEHLLREAQVLRPRRSKTDDLRKWWSGAMPTELVERFPGIRWDAVDKIYRSPRPHPLFLAAVLHGLCTPDSFQTLIRAQALQCDIEGNWEAIGDSAVWHLPRRLVWEIKAGTNLSAVASNAGISAEALRHWLRRNPEVKRIRSSVLADRQLEERRSRIRKATALGKGRSEIMLMHSADVRWLELHDATWISEQWRGLWGRSRRQQQRNLF